MKTMIFTTFLLLSSLLLAEEPLSKTELRRATQHYQRLMESAHPLPDMQYFKNQSIPSIMAPKSKSIFFKNVNTIDDETQEVFRMQNESSIAVNPTNPLNLIASAVDYRATSSTWVYVSSDGGHSWKDQNLGKPFPNWRASNDPSVYFATDGTGYMCYGGFGEFVDSFAVSVGENGVFIAKTTDEGKTWKAHIPVIVHRGVQTLDSTFEDKYYVQVDNSPASPYFGHLYIPWKRVTPRDSATQIVMSKSTDKGETWSPPKFISERLAGSSEDTTFGQSFPLITTGPLGEVYLVWNHGIEHGVGFAKSLDGGDTWTSPRIIHHYNIFGTTRLIKGQGYRHTVKEKVRAEAYPVVICDNIESSDKKGNLYLCWAADNIPNIYFSRSLDGGDTWSEPVIVHSDTTNDQFWPWMSIDPLSGDLAIMYFDSRNDAANLMVECYVSYSADGGISWSDRRAADQMSDLRLNPFSNNAFAGDYSGCAFYDGYVYPTWVDMRSAVLDLSDSDVFTAIINTQAPLPVENFAATILPEEPTSLSLKWENPAVKSFGQTLNSEDYNLVLFRNGEYAHTLPGGTSEFKDTLLAPYQKFDYEIFAVAGNDSSLARELTSYSGGSKEPGTPQILASKGAADYELTLKVRVPDKRADEVTVLSNLKSLSLYRDNEFIKKIDLQLQDTGKIIEISDETAREGFYEYIVSANDLAGNEGFKSARFIAYSGEINYFSEKVENFDSPVLPKYYIKGEWLPTDEISVSNPKSFAIAPRSNYKDNEDDTLMIFPFVTNNLDYFVSFYHAAILATNDYATVEYSTDGEQWSNDFSGRIARWNKSDYPAWQDKELNELDWKLEEYQLPQTNDTLLLRWRFHSNQLITDKGWYLDDIKLSNKSVSVNSQKTAVEFVVYPNPAAEYIKIRIGQSSPDISYKLVSTLGETISQGGAKGDAFGEFVLNLTKISAGSYYLIILNNENIIQRNSIMVVR